MILLPPQCCLWDEEISQDEKKIIFLYVLSDYPSRHEIFRPSVRPHVCVRQAQATTLDSDTGWTGDFWSKTYVLK